VRGSVPCVGSSTNATGPLTFNAWPIKAQWVPDVERGFVLTQRIHFCAHAGYERQIKSHVEQPSAHVAINSPQTTTATSTASNIVNIGQLHRRGMSEPLFIALLMSCRMYVLEAYLTLSSGRGACKGRCWVHVCIDIPFSWPCTP
jgi:hypothetical protein